MDRRVCESTSSSKVSSFSDNVDSSAQYGSIIVCCDVQGLSSLILMGGVMMIRIPKLSLLSLLSLTYAAQLFIFKIMKRKDCTTLLRKRRYNKEIRYVIHNMLLLS